MRNEGGERQRNGPAATARLERSPRRNRDLRDVRSSCSFHDCVGAWGACARGSVLNVEIGEK